MRSSRRSWLALNGSRWARARGENAFQVAYSSPNAEASVSYDFDNVSHAESVIIQLYSLIHLAEPPLGVLWVSAPRAAVQTPVLRRWLERALQSTKEASIQLLVNVTDPEIHRDSPGVSITLFERPEGGRVQIARKTE